MPETKNIAFVCLHGSAKSLIAAEYFNKRAAERGLALRAFSAGQEPDAAIPPHVVAGLGAKGIDLAGRVPNAATAERLATAQRVVHFGCDLAAVVKPGQPLESWADCPAVSDGFEPAWQYITRRVDEIVAKGAA
jgi:arsenate reductase